MNIRLAEGFEFDNVQKFYYNLIDMMQDSRYFPGWVKGVYPSDDYLREAIAKRELWVCEIEGEIAAAVVLNHDCNDGYKDVNWSVEAKSDEVLIVHALGVLPTFHGQGIASAMLDHTKELGKRTNQKAIRLDVLLKNAPAEKLYIKHGFCLIDTLKLYYDNTGLTEFKLYEYRL